MLINDEYKTKIHLAPHSHLPTFTKLFRHAVQTYFLLTPWVRVLLEKLTGFQLVKKFPAFYEIRKFITSLTSSRHLFRTKGFLCKHFII
jgi:hypothetical protein